MATAIASIWHLALVIAIADWISVKVAAEVEDELVMYHGLAVVVIVETAMVMVIVRAVLLVVAVVDAVLVVVEAVGQGVIEATMDQFDQSITVTKCTRRSIGTSEWTELSTRLKTLRANIGSVLEEIKQKKA